MLNKNYRFSLRTENTRLKKTGRKFYTPYFTVVSSLRLGNFSTPRFNVLLSKKISQKAIVRNRVKRSIYSILYLMLEKLNKPLDILIIPHPKILTLNKKDLDAEINKTIKPLFGL